MLHNLLGKPYQKLCYIEMFVNIEKSGEQDKERSEECLVNTGTFSTNIAKTFLSDMYIQHESSLGTFIDVKISLQKEQLLVTSSFVPFCHDVFKP